MTDATRDQKNAGCQSASIQAARVKPSASIAAAVITPSTTSAAKPASAPAPVCTVAKAAGDTWKSGTYDCVFDGFQFALVISDICLPYMDALVTYVPLKKDIRFLMRIWCEYQTKSANVPLSAFELILQFGIEDHKFFEVLRTLESTLSLSAFTNILTNLFS